MNYIYIIIAIIIFLIGILIGKNLLGNKTRNYTSDLLIGRKNKDLLDYIKRHPEKARKGKTLFSCRSLSRC